MFDEKAILARLQNGEDAQTIANEMADMINKANKMYADELAKAEEAKRAEEKKKALELQKTADLQDILDQFAAWFQEYYGIDAGDELKADSVMEIIDGVQEYMEALKGLKMVIDKKPAVKVTKKASADDTINQFLKNMGW
jgi:dsDNA-specific endonuclease/ATPase MutS2